MLENCESIIPDIVPKQLSVKGRSGKPVEFEIEFYVFANGMSMIATEMGKLKRRAEVRGDLEDNFDTMFETLKQRIKKALSVKYMEKSGYIAGDKAVGYIGYNSENDSCEIIIDGKPYSWVELGKNIKAREGWNIKIEFGCAGDELDGGTVIIVDEVQEDDLYEEQDRLGMEAR